MAALVYALGAASSVLCALLLLRQYRIGKQPLVLWSGLCFCGLALTNVLVFVDLVVVPEVDLYLWRLGIVAASLCLLVFGLVWESK